MPATAGWPGGNINRNTRPTFTKLTRQIFVTSSWDHVRRQTESCLSSLNFRCFYSIDTLYQCSPKRKSVRSFSACGPRRDSRLSKQNGADSVWTGPYQSLAEIHFVALLKTLVVANILSQYTRWVCACVLGVHLKLATNLLFQYKYNDDIVCRWTLRSIEEFVWQSPL